MHTKNKNETPNPLLAINLSYTRCLSRCPQVRCKLYSEIHPESIENQVWTRKCGVIPKCPWIAPWAMLPQGAKVEAPAVPNDMASPPLGDATRLRGCAASP